MLWSDLQPGFRASVVYSDIQYRDLVAHGVLVAVEDESLTIDTGHQEIFLRRAAVKTINREPVTEPKPERRKLLAIEVVDVSAQHPNGLRLLWLVVPESIVERDDEPGVADVMTSDGRRIRLVRSTIKDWKEIEIE